MKAKSKIWRTMLLTAKVLVIVSVIFIGAIGVPFTTNAFTINVNGQKRIVKTDKLFVVDVIKTLPYGRLNEDFVLKQKITEKTMIRDIPEMDISTKKIVKVKLDENMQEVKTYVHTIGDFFEEQNIALTEQEKGENASFLKSSLSDGMSFQHVSETIQLPEQRIETEELMKGQEVVENEGHHGTILKLIFTASGQPTIDIYKRQTQAAQPRIIKVGNKVEEKKVDDKIETIDQSKQPSGFAVPSGSVWDALAICESGGNWNINTGNGYHGGLQFSVPTWNTASRNVGLDIPYAHLATREQQIMAATWLQEKAGWGQWPHCASKLGLY